MFFRWMRFQGQPTYVGANDNGNGPCYLTSARLRRWHVHTEYLAGSAATISLTYLAHRNPITGLLVLDFAHILQNCVVAPSGLNPQDQVLDFGEGGYPLPQINAAVSSGGKLYILGIYTSTNTLTGGFLNSDLEFDFDFPYQLPNVTPFWIN